MQKTAPYGSWVSPITVDLLTGGSAVSLGYVRLTDNGLYWLEGRPHEGGRSVLVFRPDGAEPIDVVPRGFNVRSRIHEYGGGSYWLHGSTVLCSNFDDGRVYRFDSPGGEGVPITPEPPELNALRHADGRVTPDGRLVVCVRERHEGDTVTNELVAFPADGSGELHVVASGHDFFSSPRISPDGGQLAWTTWDDPRMPFDGTELHVANLAADGTLSGERVVAGSEEESVVDPRWSPDGVLHYVSDRTGWWNLYADGIALTSEEAEFAYPPWVFDIARYAFLEGGRIACIVTRAAQDGLEVLDPKSGALSRIELPISSVRGGPLTARGPFVALAAGGPTENAAVQLVNVDSGEREIVRRAVDEEVDPRYLSKPNAIEFPGADGEPTYAFFYPPANPDFEAPVGELPPLVVGIHGGPTAHVGTTLDLYTQFLTSRGIAVVDVNYGGSTGYGRVYRERLYGRWGEVDVEDSTAAARALIRAGEVDPERIMITGGSAGGYTTLLALALRDDFAAGISLFGVADLELLVHDTHKFEAHYEHSLVGPYPERIDLYKDRSPITHADRISVPLLLLQGLDDKVVPPAQSEAIAAALNERGIPYAYLAFEGEGHGFRGAEAQRRSLEATLSFLGQVFGFEPADELEPLRVENLQPAAH